LDERLHYAYNTCALNPEQNRTDQRQYDMCRKLRIAISDTSFPGWPVHIHDPYWKTICVVPTTKPPQQSLMGTCELNIGTDEFKSVKWTNDRGLQNEPSHHHMTGYANYWKLETLTLYFVLQWNWWGHLSFIFICISVYLS